MHRRRGAISLAAALAVLGTMLVSTALPASADDLATTGRFEPVFSPNGDFDAAPPATVAESTRYPAAVSNVALPNGKFVYWNGLENLETAKYPLPLNAADVALDSRSRQLDLGSGTPSWKTPSPEGGGGGDMFCADQRILLDGTVMVTGGTIWRNDPVDVSSTTYPQGLPGGTTELFGNNATRIYSSDASGGTWSQVGSKIADHSYTGYMKYGRWYPALVTLPTGKLLVSGGVGRLLYNSSGLNVAQTETFNPYAADGSYDPKNGKWTDNGVDGQSTFPLFPRLHVIHDGRVFYGASGQMWGPFGNAADEALWNFMKFYDPATNKWTDVGTPQGTDASVVDRAGLWGAVSGAGEVMLPYKPDADGKYTSTTILQAGGVLGTSPGSFVATNLSRLITIKGDSVQSKAGATLNNRRWYSSLITGASGEPMIFNGADKDEVICGGCESAIHQAEIYDADADKWTAMATMERDRTYHNSAILLADGRVLIGGHSPINTFYGPGSTTGYTANDLHNATNGVPGGTANNFKDSSFQIFDPPYLFRGPRPSITTNVSGILNWGSDRNITTPDAATVQDAILVHMPATTHTTDGDARSIVLPIVDRQNGSVKVHIPSERGVATPGYYYLFLRQTNPGFTKPTVSSAIIVRVGNDQVFGAVAGLAPASAVIAGTTAAAPVAPLATTVIAKPAPAAAIQATRPVSSHRNGGSQPAAAGLAVAALLVAGGAGFRARRMSRAER